MMEKFASAFYFVNLFFSFFLNRESGRVPVRLLRNESQDVRKVKLNKKKTNAKKLRDFDQ